MKQVRLLCSRNETVTEHFEDTINNFLRELNLDNCKVLGFKQTETADNITVMIIYEDNEKPLCNDCVTKEN